MLREQAQQIFELLEPCLEKKQGYYHTNWGRKTPEGVIASIQAILEKDTGHSEDTYQQQEESNES